MKLKMIDTGKGICEENRKKLFNTFVKADSSTAAKYGSTGLGLWIGRKIIQLMGGQVAIETKLNQGTNFILLSPFLATHNLQFNLPKHLHSLDHSVPSFLHHTSSHRMLCKLLIIHHHIFSSRIFKSFLILSKFDFFLLFPFLRLLNYLLKHF